MPSARGRITSQSWISPRTLCSSLAARRASERLVPEAALDDLEHVAQPLGGDPHARAGRSPRRDRGPPRQRSAAPRAGVGRSAPRCGAAISPGRASRRSRAFTRRPPRPARQAAAQLLAGARGRRTAPDRRLPRSRSSRSRGISARGPDRAPGGDPTAKRSRNSISTSRSRRSPERVGERLDLLQRPAEALAREAGLRRPPSRPAGGASPPACRGHARVCRGRARPGPARRPRPRAPRPPAAAAARRARSQSSSTCRARAMRGA